MVMKTHRAGGKRAHAAVCRAVKAGHLPDVSTQVCSDCGTTATEYDHRDYNKPLVVEPVCRSCNHARGPAIPQGAGRTYTAGFGHGYVVTRELVRAASFEVIDFGEYETEAA